MQPDMQVAGAGSSNTLLNYYVDRIDGVMPQPVVFSLPLWTWRVIMLLWSLWLAASLVRWLQKGWTALGNGGWYRPIPGLSPKSKAKADTETAEPTGDAG
jgi:hypothetical protein